MHGAEGFQCTSLIDDIVRGFLVGDIHQAAAKTHEIRKARMCTDGDIVFFGPLNRAPHPRRITRMEPTGHVRMRDPFHHLFWATKDEVAE